MRFELMQAGVQPIGYLHSRICEPGQQRTSPQQRETSNQTPNFKAAQSFNNSGTAPRILNSLSRPVYANRGAAAPRGAARKFKGAATSFENT